MWCAAGTAAGVFLWAAAWNPCAYKHARWNLWYEVPAKPLLTHNLKPPLSGLWGFIPRTNSTIGFLLKLTAPHTLPWLPNLRSSHISVTSPGSSLFPGFCLQRLLWVAFEHFCSDLYLASKLFPLLGNTELPLSCEKLLWYMNTTCLLLGEIFEGC